MIVGQLDHHDFRKQLSGEGLRVGFGPFNLLIRSDLSEFSDIAHSLYEHYPLADRNEICDFAAGNPQEGTIGGYAEALKRWADARQPDWFAYKLSEPEAQAVVAGSLRTYLGIPFEPEDIVLTNASIAALAVTLRTVCEPGDEVVIVSPPHYLYEPLIRAAGAATIRVKVLWETFDLDLRAVAGALTPRTRAMIVNTPHNPTGKIFPPPTLRQLAGLLADA